LSASKIKNIEGEKRPVRNPKHKHSSTNDRRHEYSESQEEFVSVGGILSEF